MSATERAYTFTKQRILDGRLPGGELITEGDVAAQVGVSRTPVREAFLRLQSEGLLRLYPKRGALVVPVSPAEVESVMETRLVVERFAFEKAIRTEAEVTRQVERIIARQHTLAGKGDIMGFVEADREFHRVYVAAVGNPILLGLYDSLRDRQSRMGLAALARNDDRIRQILTEHEGIVQAVVDRDEELVRERVDAHLDLSLVLLREGTPVPVT